MFILLFLLIVPQLVAGVVFTWSCWTTGEQYCYCLYSNTTITNIHYPVTHHSTIYTFYTSTVNTSLILESHCLFSHCAKILHNRKPGLMMHKHFRQNGSKVSLACTYIVVGLGWRNERYSILFNYGGNTN